MENSNFKRLFELYEKDGLKGNQKKAVDVFFKRMQHNGLAPEEVDAALEKKMLGAIMKLVKKSERKKTGYWIRIAAVAFILIGVSSYVVFGGLFNTVQQYKTVTAGAGEKTEVLLPDGSLVYLTAGSTLQYPEHFNTDERCVTLKGEGCFEVKREEAHPFFVHSQTFVTRVLGTQFVVSDVPGEVADVTVISGKVRVAGVENGQAVVLVKNEQVVFNNLTGQLSKRMLKSMKDYEFWISGEIRFDNATIKAVAQELSKRFKVTIVLKNPENDCAGISGSFKGDSVESILRGISFINNMEYKAVSETRYEMYLKPCTGKTE